MTFVVTENCSKCRFTDCVAVCPVDCFYGDDERLYIHPDECIDCGACEPECPVKAISAEDDVLDADRKWIEINKEKSSECDNITQKQDPLPTAEEQKLKLGY